MSSEPRPAVFRMPERLFAELASGGGDMEAIAFLERAERARRLILLRTLLDRLAGVPTPLATPADAWSVLKEAAERAPEAVEGLLAAPATGGWIAHMLRRLHGTATGPPLWAEAGHLNLLALTAALRAGTATALDVPLTDGAAHLPALGRVRLPAARPGLTVALATTTGRGELTLSAQRQDGSPTSLTCRPATAPRPSPAPPRPAGPRCPAPPADRTWPVRRPRSAGSAAHRAPPSPGRPAPGHRSAPAPSGRVPCRRRPLRRAEATGHTAPLPAPASADAVDTASWRPLRTLTHTAPTGPVAIPLTTSTPTATSTTRSRPPGSTPRRRPSGSGCSTGPSPCSPRPAPSRARDGSTPR
ncbi:hypothetical protein SVIOM342S_08083 [Streptomyces violaceorubidus]